MLTGNWAGVDGGGVHGGCLNNCTLTGNSAGASGGGVDTDHSYGGALVLKNCILYFNTAPVGANHTSHSSSTMDYCCTTPMPIRGVGNTTLDPQLASASHLSLNSPCRGAGSADYVSGVDIDGEAWANPPSIGCDEYHAGAVAGPLRVSILASYTNVAVGFAVELAALIEGPTTASVWDFGGGAVLSNRPYASHAWATPGDYVVGLRAYNETYPDDVSATLTIYAVPPPVHCCPRERQSVAALHVLGHRRHEHSGGGRCN